MRFLGLDPGLRVTGWGVIDSDGAHLSYVASGTLRPDPALGVAARLAVLHDGLAGVIAAYRPDAAAVEETFVNRNAASALKLGEARGVALLAPALAGLEVSEYAANLVKKAVVGAGHAAKEQVAVMVRTLLPGCRAGDPDATDALAVAICHAHHSRVAGRWAAAESWARPRA